MKTLLLVRHAKSEHHFTALSDFERTLNERGSRDAAEMATRLVKKNIRIDQFVSSSAKRARTTAEIFMEQYEVPEEQLMLYPELYHAAPPVFLQVITQLHDKYDTIAIFAHNPGITDFAGGLTTVKTDNMPTSSVFAVGADVDSWAGFAGVQKNFLFFDFPKS